MDPKWAPMLGPFFAILPLAKMATHSNGLVVDVDHVIQLN